MSGMERELRQIYFSSSEDLMMRCSLPLAWAEAATNQTIMKKVSMDLVVAVHQYCLGGE